MNIEKRFDPHKWNSVLCTSEDDIGRILFENQIRNKKIKSIQPIGIAQELKNGEGFHLLRHELHEQGSPYWEQSAPEFAYKKYPHVFQTMVRCEVTLEEPIVITFIDNSTMELWPHEGEGLRIGFNQILPDIVDGVNDSNFDASSFFSCLMGESIIGFHIWQDTQERLDGSEFHKKITRSYQFGFHGFFGFTLKEDCANQFKLELTNQRCFVGHHRNPSARISFEEYMNAAKENKQIPLTVGGGLSRGFAFMPTPWDPESSWFADWFEGNRKEMVTLTEDDAYAFLLYFFAKHCSTDFPVWTWGDWEEHEDSEDDIHYNKVVSYALMREIITDIRDTACLLKSDYDNPKLAELKSMFDPYCFDRMIVYQKPEPAQDEVMRKNVDVVIRFYERFCWLIENMLKKNSQYQYISIWGP